MGAEPQLVGPFPEGVDPEGYDRLRRRILWSMPSGLYVLGTRVPGRRNLMTLNWATQVAVEPKLVAVSVEAAAVSHGLLRDGRVFSLNILPREQRAMVRKFVKPLDDDGDPDHLGGFALRAGLTGAPVLAEAAAWLECEVRHDVPCGSHTLFVGEVVSCGGEVDDGLEVLRMEDTRMSYGG
ncbi:MAG TPA: flavin reductase family protein [Acidimicrobiales bacterium]|jgi:flavin reductase (DIM6/NTAB) family NADH-FMN oxidoreductase RutF